LYQHYFTPNSHQKAASEKATLNQMAREGKGEQRKHRILNSSKQAFPKCPETEQQRMRVYVDISDVLTFKLLFSGKKNSPFMKKDIHLPIFLSFICFMQL